MRDPFHWYGDQPISLPRAPSAVPERFAAQDYEELGALGDRLDLFRYVVSIVLPGEYVWPLE